MTPQQEKIRRFMHDEVMSNAVYEVLLNSFLEPKEGQDVNMLAASMIAVGRLKAGWRELEKLKLIAEGETNERKQIGL